jgi:branched-chain amino acid transport system permease protein
VTVRRLWTTASYTLVVVVLMLAVLGPIVFTEYFTSAVALRTLWMGLAAASITFLAGYAGMVSLGQMALFGVAGFTLAKLSVEQGWDPWLAALAGVAAAVGVALFFGAIASASEGIYFLMITLAFGVLTFYYFSQVPTFGAHEGINGAQPPDLLGDPILEPTRLYYAAIVTCFLVYAAVRYLRGTAFGLTLQGVRDDPVRMSALGFAVRLHRTLGFAAGAVIAALAGVLATWSNTRISPGSIDLTRTIDVLAAAVIGGLYRLEGAWIGAFVFVVLDTYTRGISDRFQTYIGVVFLAIVVVSPDGVMGLWRAVDRRVRGLAGAGEVATESLVKAREEAS